MAIPLWIPPFLREFKKSLLHIGADEACYREYRSMDGIAMKRLAPSQIIRRVNMCKVDDTEVIYTSDGIEYITTSLGRERLPFSELQNLLMRMGYRLMGQGKNTVTVEVNIRHAVKWALDNIGLVVKDGNFREYDAYVDAAEDAIVMTYDIVLEDDRFDYLPVTVTVLKQIWAKHLP